MKFLRLLKFVDRFHWLWLLLAAPFLLFPSPTRSLAMLVVPFLWLLHWILVRQEISTGLSETQEWFPVTPLNGAILLLALMLLVSVWITFSISFSLSKITGVVMGLGVFVAVVRESRKARGWLFCILAFFLIGLFIAGVGLLGTAWFTTKITVFNLITAHLPRLLPNGLGADTGIQANETGGGLIWVLPALIAASAWLVYSIRPGIRQKKDAVEKKEPPQFSLRLRRLAAGLFLLGLCFVGGVFLLAQSRGAYLGLALCLTAMVLIALPSKKRRLGLIVLLILVAAGGAWMAAHWEAVRLWVSQGDPSESGALSLSSLPRRFDIWSRAISAISDFPITGMGMGTFRKVFPKLYPLFGYPMADYDIGHAHNEFLQAALDLGLPGLFGFVSLYVGAYWMLVRCWLAVHTSAAVKTIEPFFGPASNSFLQAMILGLGGGLSAHLLYSLTDAVALGAKPGILFWLLLALICGLFIQVDSKKGKAALQ